MALEGEGNPLRETTKVEPVKAIIEERLHVEGCLRCGGPHVWSEGEYLWAGGKVAYVCQGKMLVCLSRQGDPE